MQAPFYHGTYFHHGICFTPTRTARHASARHATPWQTLEKKQKSLARIELLGSESSKGKDADGDGAVALTELEGALSKASSSGVE